MSTTVAEEASLREREISRLVDSLIKRIPFLAPEQLAERVADFVRVAFERGHLLGQAEALRLFAAHRASLEAKVRELTERQVELEAKVRAATSGLLIKGWWCPCGLFNGEEHSPRDTCRRCGTLKADIQQSTRT